MKRPVFFILTVLLFCFAVSAGNAIGSECTFPVQDDGQPAAESATAHDTGDMSVFDRIAAISIGDTVWMLWIIVPLVGVGYLMMRRADRSLGSLFGFISVFLLLSGFEIAYAMGDQTFAWFCRYPKWWIKAVCFVIFGLAALAQLMMYFTFLGAVCSGRMKVGIYSWGVAIAAAIVVSIFGIEKAVGPYIGYALILCQIIQMCIVFACARRHTGVFTAAFLALTYAVTTLATAIVLGQFISLLIVVIVLCYLLKGFAEIKTDPEPDTVHLSNGTRLYKNHLTGEWEDNYGGKYIKSGADTFIKQ